VSFFVHFISCRSAPMGTLKTRYLCGSILALHRLQTSLAIHIECSIWPCHLMGRQ